MKFKTSTVHYADYLPDGFTGQVVNKGDEVDLSFLKVGECTEVGFYNSKNEMYGINRYQRVE